MKNVILKNTFHFKPLLFAWLFLYAAGLYGQLPALNYYKLGSEEGLTNANIFSITQGQNGLMYFATQNGVFYYDGYSCNKLSIDSLKSNALLGACLKNEQEIYLSINNEGIAEYNLHNGNYKMAPTLKVPENNADIFFVKGDYAYLLTSGIKLVMVHIPSGKIIQDEVKQKSRMNVAYCVLLTRENRVLVGRQDGLYEVVGDKQVRLNFLQNMPVHSLCEDVRGKLLAGSGGKLFVINDKGVENEITPEYKTKSSTFLPDGERNITRILADEYGRTWFTSSPDESIFLYKNNQVYNLFELLGLPPTLVNCVYKDARQNIWIGTINDGVYYIQNPFFNGTSFSYNNKNLNVNSVYLKGNLLVAATSNGLYGLNLTNNQTKVLSSPDEILTEPVNSLFQKDNVLYYTKRSEMDLRPAIFFDSKNSYKFRPVIARQFYPFNDNLSVLADWYANVLLCNAEGTQVLDTLISFTDYKIQVNAFLKYNETLYIATNKGLFTFDFKTKKYQNLIRNELNFNINDLALINGKLYAAHESGITEVFGGKLLQEAGTFRLNSVKKIKEFNDQVWLATLDGVFICNKELEPLKILNKSNGLLSNSVNEISFGDNMVCIATAKGVSSTGIKNILRYNARLNPVTISEVLSQGKKLEPVSGTYEIGADEDNIRFSFISPSFNKPLKQFFRWKVDNEKWNYTNNLSFEVNLAGGKHELEIQASSDNIAWSESRILKLNKVEKFSEKQSLYWLITIGGLLLIMGISSVWIRRVKVKAKKRLREEQQVNLLKHQAMNALLSPHFIFNSLTSIQNYINTNNSLRASEYLAKFSRLIRMIIEKAAQSEITLHDELARLTYYLELEKERFKNKFDYKIQIDEKIDTSEIKIPNMIIQPHVENCIIHGILPKHSHGTLVISFQLQPGKSLSIVIEDDGIGILKAREHAKAGHKSLGTSTIQSILEVNSKLSGKKQNVSMLDKSELNPPGNGTIITIEIEL